MLKIIDDAVAAGARMEKVCQRLSVTPRTIQRWRTPLGAEDRRCGPHTSPANRLSESERRRVLAVANCEEFRDVSPKQMVPRLADRGLYLASESTVYRLLRAEGQLAHRGQARPRQPRPRPEFSATAPNQVWSWDITYLRGPVRGAFLYLYFVVDVFSRRIMGWHVSNEECMEQAARLINQIWNEAGGPVGLKLHSDNGGPMKGSTMLSTMQALGIVPSFSRPQVSDDNPFSEALFRTLKYRPSFPSRPFSSIDEASSWVLRFVAWYNLEHRHSAIRFVTPEQRYTGAEVDILAARHDVYRRAHARHPSRWTTGTRNWTKVGPVRLGPSPTDDSTAPLVTSTQE
jgi:transposase InsO family protein